MKYYILSNSSNKSEIGVFPQTTGLVDGYNEFAENSMANLNSDQFPDFVPDLRFDLEKEAILTDVISASNLDYAKGLLVNRRTKKLIEAHRILSHRYYQAQLRVKDQILEYFWLHIVNPSFEFIDFPQSVFSEIISKSKSENFTFKSEFDFEQFYTNTINSVKAQKIVLKQEISSKNYDLLFFPFIHRGLIASERLCYTLTSEHISGIAIEDQSFI